MMRTKVISFLNRTFFSIEKCRVLSCPMSTSLVCQNRFKDKPNLKTSFSELYDDTKKNYEDTFGDIDGFEQKFAKIKEDPEDILEYQREKAAQAKSIIEYIREIKSHLSNHDYGSAIKVLEVDMVNDKKRLNPFVYKILISYNAKIGNVKEAYRLFIKFKKRGGIVRGAIYTSMFNACANSKDSLLAIQRAIAVEECMRNNKFHSINISNYNVMLKAFGRHGDLPSCFRIMDEVLEKRGKTNSDTYCFLLQACVSDKNSGLRHAFITWRKMLQNLVKPDLYCFHTMLKCTAECSLGDTLLIPSIMKEIEQECGKFFKRKIQLKEINGKTIRVLKRIPTSGTKLLTQVVDKKSKSPEKNNKDLIQLHSIESKAPVGGELESSQKEISSDEIHNMTSEQSELELSKNKKDLCVSNESVSDLISNSEELVECENVPKVSFEKMKYPNLIAFNPTLGDIIEFDVMTEPHHRFMLLGGVKGFLKSMSEFGVEPNIVTITLMLNVIPQNVEAEKELISVAESYKIKLDITFFIVLIKRRIFRKEDDLVKECLEKMYSLNLKPNLLLFGVLALACRTTESAKDLIKTLHNYGYRANNVILLTLLKNASFAKDMNYVLYILKVAKEDEVDLDEKFVATLNKIVVEEKRRKKKDSNNAVEELDNEMDSIYPSRMCEPLYKENLQGESSEKADRDTRDS